jgi:hypothetical protein
MAKIPNQRSKYNAHYERIERYTDLIESIFSYYNQEAAKLAIKTGYKGDKPFSFSQYTKADKKIKELLKSFSGDIKIAIVNGVTSEWKESNLKNDQLAKTILNYYSESDFDDEHFSRYFNNHDQALKAFIIRKDNGMNLSKRIWNMSKDYKSNLELAITDGISEGQSAAELSRNIRKFLKEPDKLFRRVRNKYGELKLSNRAQGYNPGAGSYRSSYKNAMRLARTEINMSYRNSDMERWNEFDFVVGYEVKRSSKPYHCPLCESLAGKYPKNFVFTGWHPQCRCYVIPILKTTDEMYSDNERILNGHEPSLESVNSVNDVPSNYKQWVEDNSVRIKKAKKSDSLPYFLKDNPEYQSFPDNKL